ncbi:hypothetical protein EHQ76_09300 [Leptospira barantonii]|uniref:7(1) septoil knot domain-containing protein n=1 Tax=Leptospira barantonii TaxID=2023184 RepID=A0A5F2BCX2_9LEPT|nr:hypothetical protein [Leptospira barantonii]TGM03405.1 hypothetical protein EHQ76_09300 [Leptospira barantonii]
MKRILFSFCLFFFVITNGVQAKNKNIAGDCTFNGKKLYGKIKVVTSFPDVKVKVVDSFSDLKVKVVDSFPDSCGKWKMVESSPNTKIKFVTSFPDVKIEYVSSSPGLK